MKKLLSVIALLIWSASVFAHTHTVARGESLQSIAAKYNITEAQLIEANPGVDKLFYIGLKLDIPQPIAPATESYTSASSHPQIPKTPSHSSKQPEYTVRSSEKSRPTVKTSPNEEKRFELSIFAGVSMNSYVGDGIKNAKMKLGFNAGLSGRFFIYDGCFAELAPGISTKGYKKRIFITSGAGWVDDGPNFDEERNIDLATYNIDVPLYLGYRIPVGNNSKLSIKVGPYLTYAVSGRQKTTGYYIYYPDIHSSERETINEEIKFKDMKNLDKMGFGLCGGLGYNFKNIGIGVNYQRGLTKVLKKQKVYEQNISAILSYTF